MLKKFLSFAVISAAAVASAQECRILNNSVLLEGGVEVVSIEDASNQMDISLFSGTLTEAQKKVYMPNGKAAASVNVFLVKSAGKTYLIDAGFGNAVKDKRIDPKKIDAVFVTHEHADHISGLLDGDSAIFQAPIYISKPESDYWLNQKTKDYSIQRRLANVYANRYKTFAFGDTLSPGIVAISAVGHTPGHTAFLIGNGKQKLLIAGDFLHAAALQFPEPGESASFDVDKVQAAKTRRMLMEQAEKNNWLIAGMHLPSPAIGRVKSNGKNGFKFECP